MKAVGTVPLGEVAEFVRGINFKPNDVVAVGTPNTVACMRTKNVQEQLDFSDVWAVHETFVRRDDQRLQEGDILVSSANSWNLVGKCSWVPALPWQASFGGFVSVLRPSSEGLDRRYLYRWFSSEPVQETLRSFGQKTTNISNLNISRCQRLVLPLPPLSEQRRIASILDQAETLRTQRRAALAQLDDLAQSIFLDMFGEPGLNTKRWPLVRMAELFVTSPIFGTMIPGAADSGSWLCLRVANIQDWQLDLSDQKFVDLPDSMLERHVVQDGDLLMARAIATQDLLGKCIVARPGAERWAFDSHLMRLRFRPDRAAPEFIRQLLRTPGGRGIFLKASRKSSVQYNINTKEIAGLELPVPPVAIQQAFVERLQAIEALKNTHRTALAQLDALFASLQHRAFAGSL